LVTGYRSCCCGPPPSDGNRLGAVVELIKVADEEVRDIFAGLATDIFPDRRDMIAIAGPAKLFAVLPDVLVGFFFVLAHQMAYLMEQDRGTLGFVDRVCPDKA
jgi:hypothetical protein